MSHHTIFVVKESRNGEKRVSLIPDDVAILIDMGCKVLVESDAGISAGYFDIDYQRVGASIVKIEEKYLQSYKDAFSEVGIIVRAKRPNRAREKLEIQAIKPGTKMIGSLDLLEKESNHVAEYKASKIDYYSFDQFDFPNDSPMNDLGEMSAITGQLAVSDAIKRLGYRLKKVMIIGYGKVGQSAHIECLKHKFICMIVTSQQSKVALVKSHGSDTLLLKKELSIEVKQSEVEKRLHDINLIITCASENGKIAPIFISKKMFSCMKKGTVIMDLSVPEGGNVVGSRADESVTVGNDIQIVNVSGYPKLIPVRASKIWSKVSCYFIRMLINKPEMLFCFRRKRH